LLRNVVYSRESTAVRHVYVHGEPAVRDGRLVKQSERAIGERVRVFTEGWS
jgi:cytosine/adenosine deaminase-related metal-dependent hydrolase